ncbi:teicoplanin resistance protein VanZ [Clostridia bacterium]|nr:teicoplanin resistance protein VanZ [Clostridia bacterium]
MRKVFNSPWFWCIAAIMVVVILGVLSSQNAEISNRETLKVTNIIYTALPQWAKGANAEADILAVNYFIRKMSHFLIFVLITITLFSATSVLKMREALKYVLILLLVTLIACSDEFHQSFTGRGASFTDVLIDISGAVFVYLIIGLRRVIRKIRKGLAET